MPSCRRLREAFWVKPHPLEVATWLSDSLDPAKARARDRDCSQSASCPKHIEFLDTEAPANSCVETSLGPNSYYGSCKQSELTACQALSHEKWKMNDDNDGQVNCFRGGAVSEVLPTQLAVLPLATSHWPKSLLLAPEFLRAGNLTVYLPQKCEYLWPSLAQVSTAVAVPFVTCLVYGLSAGCVFLYTLGAKPVATRFIGEALFGP